MNTSLKMKLNKLKLVHFPIIIFASIGLIIQVIYISERYFQFQTRTTISVKNPQDITIPSLSSCWDMKDILNVTAVNEETDQNVPSYEEYRANASLYWEAVDQITVKQLFMYTPSNESILRILNGCIFRLPRKYTLKHPLPRASECYDIFRIHKYIHRGMMCYSFSFRESIPDIDVGEYSLTPEISGLLYRLYFDENYFGNVRYYSTYLHGKNTSRLYDSMYTAKKFHHRNSTGLLNVDLTYSAVENLYLPSPYDTHCRDVPGYDSRSRLFYQKVRVQLVESLHRVDSFDFIEKDYNYPLLGMKSFLNETILSKVNDILSKTRLEPHFCYNHYYVSRLTVGISDSILLGVYWPEDYFTRIEHVKDQLLIDFVVYICSSIGIWFGLSFCSLSTLVETFLVKNGTKPAGNSGQGRHRSCDTRIRALFQYFKTVTRQQRSVNVELHSKVRALELQGRMISQSV